MSQILSGDRHPSIGKDLVNLLVRLGEGVGERMGYAVGGVDGGEGRAKDTGLEFSEEQGYPAAVGGEKVVFLRDRFL